MHLLIVGCAHSPPLVRRPVKPVKPQAPKRGPGRPSDAAKSVAAATAATDVEAEFVELPAAAVVQEQQLCSDKIPAGEAASEAPWWPCQLVFARKSGRVRQQ